DQEVEPQAAKFGARVRGRFRSGDAVTFAEQETREQITDAAVVVYYQQMRSVVGKSRRCRAHAAHGCLGSATRPPRAVSAGDETQHGVAVLGIEHRSQKSAGGVLGGAAPLRERPRQAGPV